MRFLSNIHKILKNYIWAYFDPTDGSYFPFYVDRGVKNLVIYTVKDRITMKLKKYLGKLIKRYIRVTVSPCHYSLNRSADVYKFDTKGRITNP